MLQFADDLHGADFRRARDRPTGKQCRHQGQQIGRVGQTSLHTAAHLVQGREGLDREKFGHLDRSHLTEARHVVAQQIDNHQVFSPRLLRGLQIQRQCRVKCGVGIAGGGALHRARLDHPALHAKEQFGAARNDHRPRTQIDKGPEPNRLPRPQGAIKAKGRARVQPRRHRKGQVDLIAVPRRDIGFDPRHRRVIGTPADPLAQGRQARGGRLIRRTVQHRACVRWSLEHPEHHQRAGSGSGHQPRQRGFQRIACLVGQIACNPVSGAARILQPCQRRDHLGRAAGDHHLDRAVKQRRHPTRTMFAKDHADLHSKARQIARRPHPEQSIPDTCDKGCAARIAPLNPRQFTASDESTFRCPYGPG